MLLLMDGGAKQKLKVSSVRLGRIPASQTIIGIGERERECVERRREQLSGAGSHRVGPSRRTCWLFSRERPFHSSLPHELWGEEENRTGTKLRRGATNRRT